MPTVTQDQIQFELMRFGNIAGGSQIPVFRHKMNLFTGSTTPDRFYRDHQPLLEALRSLPLIVKVQPELRRHPALKHAHLDQSVPAVQQHPAMRPLSCGVRVAVTSKEMVMPVPLASPMSY